MIFRCWPVLKAIILHIDYLNLFVYWELFIIETLILKAWFDLVDLILTLIFFIQFKLCASANFV